MIAIVNLNISNINSVEKALKKLNTPFVTTNKAEDLIKASKIILPGVGNFSEASKILNSSSLKETLDHQVLVEKKPILGICLGMQLLFTTGLESGESRGLGYLNGTVEKIKKKDDIRVPHMGWNNININDNGKLFKDIPKEASFYFVHSFQCLTNEQSHNAILHHTNYGGDVLASIEKDNIYATQFHPEKSQHFGLNILKNFVELC